LLAPYGDSGVTGASSRVGLVRASPYTAPPVDARRNRRAPLSPAASSTATVPRMFTVASSSGFATARETSI
jgi:hypothetical protein